MKQPMARVFITGSTDAGALRDAGYHVMNKGSSRNSPGITFLLRLI
jgi:hypothetical protein